ncbi:cupin domain-containing protein [Tropicimonas marinistellae]|uniref:cupin domain-containing protein n=1 Tax=Tropicimonas marinistellae TaxID=1739787 RepID=UPI00082C6B8F|nr:cupin domain-containing protein [Tropicimonas marinistellae]
MPLPDFLMALPALDIPFAPDVVEGRAMQTEDALLVFFVFHADVDLPPHSHGAQWGTLLQGEVEITIAGETRRYGPGQSWDIPAGAVHSARVRAGSIAIDAFEEPDRYPLFGQTAV